MHSVALIVGVLCLVAPMVAATPAAAEDGANTVEARQHYDRGVKAYNRGEFEEAYREFDSGYRAQPRAGFLLNMAHAQRRMGNLQKARELYQRYVLIEPDGPGADGARQVIDDLDRALASDARNRPDAGSTAGSGAVEPLLPDGGQTAGGRSGDAGTRVPGATNDSSQTVLVASPTDAASPAPVYRRWWFWATIGVLAVGAGVAAAFLARRPSEFEPQGSLGTWTSR